MEQKKVVYKEKQLKRINKRKALEILNHPKKYDGVTIYFLPVNANPDSPWIGGFELLTMDARYMDAVDNCNFISEYMDYNCIEDLGKYLKYYIEEDAE